MRLKDFVLPDLVARGLHDLNLILQDLIKDLQRMLNGGLTFKDNFEGKIVEITVSAAGGEVSIENVYKKKIPEGFIVINQSSGGIVYSSNAWTETNLYFTATEAGTYKLLIF